MSGSLKLRFVALICLVACEVVGQNQLSNWVFGYHSGIRFEGNSISPITGTAIETSEGCATASDSSGQLLFYSDGIQIWDRFHQPVATGLTGHWTTSQSALTVYHPANPNLYYLFTVKENGSGGISYTMVNTTDPSLSIQGLNTILDPSPVTEKITAVQAFNGVDIWIVTHGWENNHLKAWLLTAGGISPTPEVSTIGTVHGGYFENSIGCMDASPDGYWLAAAVYASNYVELYRFNNATGQATSSIVLVEPLLGGAYGVEFSPNGRLLYVTGASASRVFQWDLSSNTDTIIPLTSTLVGSIPYSEGFFLAGIQLGPDKKMYLTRDELGYLSRINSPDNIGLSCNFQKDAITIVGQGRMGLPNFASFIESEPFEAFPLCLGDSTRFVPTGINVYDSVIWDFGEPASGMANYSSSYEPFHIYMNPGTYSVTLIRYRSGMAQYFTKSITIVPLPAFSIGNDTSICSGDSIWLGVAYLGAEYLWNTGSADQSIWANSQGIYWAQASILEGCSGSDTIQIGINPLPEFDLPSDTLICDFQPITVNAWFSANSYLWSNGSTDSSIVISNSGTYVLSVTNTYNCRSADSIGVVVFGVPTLNLPDDTVICGGKTYLITPEVTFVQNYSWTDGYTGFYRTVSDTGTYVMNVYNICGTATDSMRVSFLPFPVSQLANDTVICNGDSYTIHLPEKLTVWVWGNGSFDSTYTVTESGTYLLYAQDYCYFSIDSISVDFQPDLFVPNVVTANNDGLNDCFEVLVGNKGDYTLLILNRWGKEVFRSTNPDTKWCGGDENSGHYYFHISYLDCASTPQTAKGMVFLMK